VVVAAVGWQLALQHQVFVVDILAQKLFGEEVEAEVEEVVEVEKLGKRTLVESNCWRPLKVALVGEQAASTWNFGQTPSYGHQCHLSPHH
jgi:hypothetical protein